MSGLTTGRMLALALAGMAGGALPVLEVRRAEQAPRRAHIAIPTRRYYGITFNYSNGPGWTVAQVKRMAKKARNQRRHRQACKGVRHV